MEQNFQSNFCIKAWVHIPLSVLQTDNKIRCFTCIGLVRKTMCDIIKKQQSCSTCCNIYHATTTINSVKKCCLSVSTNFPKPTQRMLHSFTVTKKIRIVEYYNETKM